MADIIKDNIRINCDDKEHLNKETIAAMMEAERISHDPDAKHYSDVEEALKELKS